MKMPAPMQTEKTPVSSGSLTTKNVPNTTRRSPMMATELPQSCAWPIVCALRPHLFNNSGPNGGALPARMYACCRCARPTTLSVARAMREGWRRVRRGFFRWFRD